HLLSSESNTPYLWLKNGTHTGKRLPSRYLPVVGQVDHVADVDVAPLAVDQLDRPGDEAPRGVQLVAGGRRLREQLHLHVVDLRHRDALAQLDGLRAGGAVGQLVAVAVEDVLGR